MNIKKGEKIGKECILEHCRMYLAMLALSNNSNLTGVVRCPDIFCQRIKQEKFECSKCNNIVSIFDGYFEDNFFHCYVCQEKPKLEIEKKQLSKNIKMDEISNLLITLSKNKDFLNNYLDKKNGFYEFYNPLNSIPTPLVWTEQYLNETGIEDLKNEILDFFKSYLIRFEEKDCNGCLLQDTCYQHMSCLDCSRNKNSPSLIKKDRFKGGE